MTSEPSPWHPTNKAVIPFVMPNPNHYVNRTVSGGKVTQQPVLYAENILPPKRMREVSMELQEWALRSLPPQQKFSRTMIDHVDGVVLVYLDHLPPGDGLPLLEEFLMALRGPYGGQHVTMPGHHRWVQDVLDFIYTLVAGEDYQQMLREQFEVPA